MAVSGELDGNGGDHGVGKGEALTRLRTKERHFYIDALPKWRDREWVEI